jgi:hypothetical protein
MRIVNAVFCTELLAPRRYQTQVEARMVFSKILSDRGHSLTSIGKFLNKNHATVIYYNRNIENLLEQFPHLLRRYSECRESFLTGREPITTLRENQMRPILESLQAKNAVLLKENIEMKNALKKYRKFERIVDLLCNSVRFGDEEVVYNRLNAMLNYK